MKKVLLTIAAFAAASSMSMAQFTITSSSLTYSGSDVPADGTNGQFYSNQPNNGGGTMYSEGTCTTPITQGEDPDQVGGFDPNIWPAATPDPGVAFYGGKLRNVYYGTPACVANIPSWGFHTGTDEDDLATTGVNIDLSEPANQVIQFDYKCDVNLSLELQLFDGAYNTKLTTVPVTIVGDDEYHTLTIDFSGNLIGAAGTLADVRQVSFLYNSDVLSPGLGFILANVKLGSVIATSINNSSAVSEANIFPNPSTGITTIEGQLKAASDVKVVLVNTLGQEVKTITEGNMTSIDASFDVSTVNKGIYSVVYYINGAPAKSQKLVVR